VCLVVRTWKTWIIRADANNPFRDQLTASARTAKTPVSDQPGSGHPAATDTLNQSAGKSTICSRGNQQDSTTSVRTGVRKSPERSIVHLRTWAQHVRRKNEQHLWQLLERSRPHPAPRRGGPPPPPPRPPATGGGRPNGPGKGRGLISLSIFFIHFYYFSLTSCENH
jgi:hypothetical protein